MTSNSPWFNFAAWLVDLDGTLYRARPVRLAMALELTLFAPHRIRVIQHFRRSQELLRREQENADHDLEASVVSPYQRQLLRAAQVLGRNVDELAPIIHEWMERRPGKWLRLFRRRTLLTEIAEFRARGGKTALVSDYPAKAKLDGLCAASLFDVIVACGEENGPRMLKPAPDGYLLAAERLGVSPGQSLVIGDRKDADGEAARRAAMAFRLCP